MSEGRNYTIQSHRCNEGQIQVEMETKQAIISELDSESQLWPGVNERMRIRCDRIRDRAILDFYNSNEDIITITNKRGIKCFESSRKVLPIPFSQFYNDFIKTKYENVSFHQFMELIPFYVFPCAVGWSSSCVCKNCSNFAYGVKLLTRLGEDHKIESVQNLKFEDCLERHVCDAKDYYKTLNCLRKREHDYCFGHIKYDQGCQQCNHSCTSNLVDFLIGEFDGVVLNETIRFPRLAPFGKERWLPIKSGLQIILNCEFNFIFKI